MDYLGELILNLLGITDPIENLREAVDQLSQQPTIEFFDPDFLYTFGLAFTISLFVSVVVSVITLSTRLRPGVSVFRALVTFTYWGETLVVGSVMLFVAQWLDRAFAAARSALVSLLPDEVVRQFIASLGVVQRAIGFEIASGIATKILLIEAQILNNMVLLLSMAFIIVYPTYHLASGPRDTVLRWIMVALGGTLISMLWLIGGAATLNIMIDSAGPVPSPVDYRIYSTSVLYLAAAAPFFLNSFLKRSRIGQRIMGAITIRGIVSTRGPATTAEPVGAQPGRMTRKITEAQQSQARSDWFAGAIKKPENLLKLTGPTRPIGSAIGVARGLKRK